MKKLHPWFFAPITLALGLPAMQVVAEQNPAVVTLGANESSGDAATAGASLHDVHFPAAPFDWAGPYYGGILSKNRIKTSGNIIYGNDGGNTPAPIGWTDNAFQGAIYNTVESIVFVGGVPETSDDITLYTWPSRATRSSSNASVSLLAGTTIQKDILVMGAEFKAAFGKFGRSTNSTGNSGGTKIGSDGEGASIEFTDQNSIIVGISSPVTSFIGVTYSATYQQSISEQTSIQFKNLNALRFRGGLAFDKVLVSGMGGLAYAHVKASTATTINETVSGSFGHGSTTDFNAENLYTFAGKKSKNMVGYTTGVSIDWAIFNNLIFRVETEYYNLGRINVNGVSGQSSATYNVDKSVTGHILSAGFIKKF